MSIAGVRTLTAVPQDRRCPLCWARVTSDTKVCTECGGDPVRSGLMLSAGVRPLSRRPVRWRSRRGLALIFALLMLSAALAELGNVPSGDAEARSLALRATRGAMESVRSVLRWIQTAGPEDAP